jgi:adenylate cyclase
LSKEIEQIKFDDIKAGYDVNSTAFERLVWIDQKGRSHNIKTPITANDLPRIRKKIEASSPQVVIDTNADGVAEERYHVVKKYQDTFIPSITLSLALNYFGVALNEVSVQFGSHILIPHPTIFDPATKERIPYSIPVGSDEYDGEGNLIKSAPRKTITDLSIPIDNNGSMIINFMGKRSSSSIDGYQTYPIRSYAGYADRIPGPDPETWPRTKAVTGKILMVGPFADGIAQDEKPTPFGLMYGIEIHANALNTILMNSFLRAVPGWLDLFLLALLIFMVAFVSSRFSAPWSLGTVLLCVVVFFLSVTFIFEYRELIIDFPKPAIGMVFTFVAVVSYRAMTEERDKKMIRATFGKYVSPRVVDQILENPPELGGVDKDLTVLFSDIRGFTTLSENMTPQELVNHLNEYLTAMTDIILEYGGTLDKYVGDEVMCFWGAPLPQQDHAVLACKCALRQMEKLHELNEHWPEAKRINIGIGLNSGIMTVGNMGSPGRMNYTLMGDNVNLGARLEGTNKQYGTNIIISEFTYGMVKDKFIVRELDNIRVKGKNKPALIFELVDSIEPLVPPLPILERKR